jgi:hypothetical protein
MLGKAGEFSATSAQMGGFLLRENQKNILTKIRSDIY